MFWLVAKPDDLSLTLRTHMVEGKNDSPDSDFHPTCFVCSPSLSHT